MIRESGSFRDPDGYVFWHGERLFRALYQSGAEAYRKFRRSQVAKWAEEHHLLTRSWELLPDEWKGFDFLPPDIAGVVEQERVPFISYPYEWTFDMLKDAAVVQLELGCAMARDRLTVKDATAYNLQFLHGKPIFIDVLSFQPYREGTPWVGYAQFCRNFYYPLLLQAHCGIDFQPLLRSYLDGIPVMTVRRMFGVRAWKRWATLKHVVGQAWLQQSFESKMPTLKDDFPTAQFSLDHNIRLMQGLMKDLGKLSLRRTSSHWSSYGEKNSYSVQVRRLKRAFVSEQLKKISPSCVWDIGCNTGEYSLLAAEYAPRVVALDSDAASVNALYLHCQSQNITRVLPLVADLIDPSPALGWGLEERKSILERGRIDCVMALALVHHLCLMRNIPLGHLFAFLGRLGMRHLLIEFVPKTDPMAKRLLNNRDDVYPWYTQPNFEREAARHFVIEERLELEKGGRVMYELVHRLTSPSHVAISMSTDEGQSPSA